MIFCRPAFLIFTFVVFLQYRGKLQTDEPKIRFLGTARRSVITKRVICGLKMTRNGPFCLLFKQNSSNIEFLNPQITFDISRRYGPSQFLPFIKDQGRCNRHHISPYKRLYKPLSANSTLPALMKGNEHVTPISHVSLNHLPIFIALTCQHHFGIYKSPIHVYYCPCRLRRADKFRLQYRL